MVRSALYVTTASRPANYGLRGIFYLPDVFRRTDAGRVGDQRSAVNRWYHDSRLPRVRFRVAAPHPCTTTIMVPAYMVNLDRRHIRPKRNRTQSSASYTRPALPLGADYYLTSLTSVMHRRTEKTRTGQPARAVAKGEGTKFARSGFARVSSRSARPLVAVLRPRRGARPAACVRLARAGAPVGVRD